MLQQKRHGDFNAIALSNYANMWTVFRAIGILCADYHKCATLSLVFRGCHLTNSVQLC